MTMKSLNLLPALRELPSQLPSDTRKSFRDTITDLVNTDRTFYAAEATAATYFALWGVFNKTNVDDAVIDRLNQAYEMHYRNLAEAHSLHEHWTEMLERGEQSADGFFNGLAGKIGEINTAEMLEKQGYTNVSIAEDPTQPVWDISAISPDGENVFIQVKTGTAGYAGEVEPLMIDNPDVHYAVSSEIYDRIADRSPELIDQMTDIGPHQFIEGAKDGLNTLSGNLGIDVPDGVVDIVPYAGAVIAGTRLVYSVLKTEKRFKAVDRTTKNKIQVVQTLTLMSRMGVTTTLAAAGRLAGETVGSAVPFLGNLVGGLIGSAAGAGMGMYLNKHLEPHMLDLALDITGLTQDDLFYYKNKVRIDEAALRFRQTAIELGPASVS